MERKQLIGHNIRLARLKRDYSQEQLALAARIQTHNLSGIERGVNNPTLDILLRIVDALEVPLEQIFASGVANSKLPRNLKPGPRAKPPRKRKRGT
jgi:transcriptional regulator with XRE-family HTH domain